jgi:acyl-CoA synthetase (AMP-forming)/AMP-acid ligase II
MNVSNIFKQHVAENPDAKAILFEALRITYGKLDRSVNRVAGGLQKLGLKRGEVLSLFFTEPSGVDHRLSGSSSGGVDG